MKNYSTASTRPDSLTGAIAAFEGINEACILLNGPLGCKVYVSYMASLLSPRLSTPKADYLSDFYFGQSRVPCTYIDEQDFIYGTEHKVTQALKMLDSKNYGLIGVVNHSGTSLIGDDLSRIIQSSNINTPAVPIESSGFNGTYASGFQNAVTKILSCITPKADKKVPKSVNLIGYTLFHYNWENDVAELERMLELFGVKVISTLCTADSIANIKSASQAELNVVVHEEYGNTIASFMEKEYGIPHIGLEIGSPYGLSASEIWFKDIAGFFKLTDEPINTESARIRKKCYPTLLRATAINNHLRGLPFGIFGDSSQVTSVTAFLYEYLGMCPVVVGVKEVGANSLDMLKTYLAENSLETKILVNPDQYELADCLNETTPRLVFGGRIEEKIVLSLKFPAQFIPFSFPYYDRVNLTSRPIVGFNGVLTLVEEIINYNKK
ncbi:hypothetical protein GX563_04555 [Candidatus Bathyarchaeota archaeon]|nr:hypothetical protein [Candidatus Bathyarchaeota archaeon]